MDLSVHMCFFIDGLDEYSGDHLEICQTLKELSEPPFIKICVSSRPWNVFEDAFGNSRDSKLYIHELTQKDILNYTQARLWDHPRWSSVSTGPNAKALESLIKEVVDKSMGVFLWVFLVTNFLREGLSNGDSLSDLRERVSSYPDDLEKFFKHILESVDRFYHKKMAGTLMVARDAGEPLATEMFMFHDREYEDEGYALHDPTDPDWANPFDCKDKFSLVPRRINGWCKGLLEWQHGKMAFLHRTVFDFLGTAEMASFLQEKAKAGFCSYLSLLRARLAWLKRAGFVRAPFHRKEPDLMEELPEFVQALREAARYARLASDEGGNTAVAVAALLDNAELGIAKMARAGKIPGSDESMAVGVFRLLLLEGRIDGYVDSKLSEPGYLRNSYANKHRSPLCFALGMTPRLPSSTSIKIDQQLLETLLDCGHDPNQVYGEDTFWTRFAEFYTFQSGTHSRADMLGTVLENGTLEKLLCYGADPTAYILISLTSKYRVPFWFQLLLIAPEIHARHKLAFERTWDLTLQHIPALCQAQCLERVYPTATSVGVWASHDLWNSMRRINLEQSKSFPLEHDSGFLLKIFAKLLERVCDSGTVYTQCRDLLADVLHADPHGLEQHFSSMKPEEAKSRKRLFEGGEGDGGHGKATKIRR